MVSYAAGARYLSLLGGACLSFYDWYCDLPPASPQVWGEQTDVPESADWYNSRYIIAWGSNVPQTRTPDAHFFTEARYNGTKTVSITPDYSEVAKLTDIGCIPKQGTDAALAFAFGHVILREFHLDKPSRNISPITAASIPICRCWCAWIARRAAMPPAATCAPPIWMVSLVKPTTPNGKPWRSTKTAAGWLCPMAASVSWGDKGRWNIEERDQSGPRYPLLLLSLKDAERRFCRCLLPVFRRCEHEGWTSSPREDILKRHMPARKITQADGSEVLVASVYDLMLANMASIAASAATMWPAVSTTDVPGTPAWQERITGVQRAEGDRKSPANLHAPPTRPAAAR